MKNKKDFKGFDLIVLYTENDGEIEFKSSDILYITHKLNVKKDGKRMYSTNDPFTVVIKSTAKDANTKFDRITWIDDICSIEFKYSNKLNKRLYIPWMDTGNEINQSQQTYMTDNGDLILTFPDIYTVDSDFNRYHIMKTLEKHRIITDKYTKKSVKGLQSIVILLDNGTSVRFDKKCIKGFPKKIIVIEKSNGYWLDSSLWITVRKVKDDTLYNILNSAKISKFIFNFKSKNSLVIDPTSPNKFHLYRVCSVGKCICNGHTDITISMVNIYRLPNPELHLGCYEEYD